MIVEHLQDWSLVYERNEAAIIKAFYILGVHLKKFYEVN